MSYRNSHRHMSAATPQRAAPQAVISIGAVLDRLFPEGQRCAAGSFAPAERSVPGALQSRALTLQPTSWNADTRTIDVVWTTGARGTRFDFDSFKLVDEELATGSGNVRLERLNRGAPVLNTHQKGDLSAQIGTVVPGSARMANGQGIATLKLSDRPEVAPLVADIAAGIIRNLSVGYTVHIFEADLKADPRPLYRAIDWEPTEISFVPVPFDVGAQTRNLAGSPATPCLIRTIQRQERPKMNMSWLSKFTRAGAPSVAAPRTPAPQTPRADEDAGSVSYDRPASITWLREYVGQLHDGFGIAENLGHELVLEMAERQLSEGDARDAVMHIMAERQRHQTGNFANGGGASGIRFPAANAMIFGERTFDNPQFLTGAIQDALFARMSGNAPTEQAREFMGMSMVQIAGEMLTRSGVRNVNRMAPNDLLSAAAWNSGGTRSYMTQRDFGAVGGFHTTSDFPQLLLGAGQRFLLEVFQAAASPLKSVSRQRSARDFREISGLELSGFGTLLEVPESGEIKHGTFRERKETYRLRTFAKQFGLSRQAIINDDLGAFADPMVIMARAAAETEASLLAELVNSNPILSDGKPLFHADHGNLAPIGSLPSVESLDEGRQAMRRQKGLDGTPLAPKPKFILSGIENETLIEKLMTAVQAGTADAANPFAGKLAPAVDPRLAPKAWYLFGDPASAPTLEHAYLDDKTGPNVEQKDGWDVLGTSFRVYMDFGAGAVDHRGAYKNPGVPG